MIPKMFQPEEEKQGLNFKLKQEHRFTLLQKCLQVTIMKNVTYGAQVLFCTSYSVDILRFMEKVIDRFWKQLKKES